MTPTSLAIDVDRERPRRLPRSTEDLARVRNADVSSLGEGSGLGCFHPAIFADCKDLGNTNICSLREDFRLCGLQKAGMAKDDKNGGPNHLRAWREHMRLTQEELGAKLTPPTTGSVISLLEDGDRGLSLKWLRRLAPVLKTTPGFLADFDPSTVDTRTLEMISQLEPAQIAQVEKFIKTFLRTGSDGI